MAFANVFKTLSKNLDDATMGRYSTLLDENPAYGQYFKALDENFELIEKEGVEILDKNTIEGLEHTDYSNTVKMKLNAGTINAVSDTLRYIHSKGRQKALQSDWDDFIKGLPADEVEKFGKADVSKKYYSFKIEAISQSSKEMYSRFVTNIENTLKVDRRAFKMFQDYFSDSKTAQSIHGYSDFDLFRAIKNPDEITDASLKNLALTFRKQDQELTKAIQQISHMGNIEDYVVPLTPNPFTVQGLGKGGLAHLITKHTSNVTSYDEALKIATDVYGDVIGKKGKNLGISYGSRKLEFKSVADEFEYYKAISGFAEAEDSSLLGAMIKHKENLIQRSYLYKEFGQDPMATLNELFSVEARRLKKAGDMQGYKGLESAQNEVANLLEVMMGRTQVTDRTLFYMSSGIERMVSGLYGAVGSAVRNAGIDFSSHGASFIEALGTGEGVASFYARRVFSIGKSSFHRIFDSSYRTELNELLDIFEFSNSTSALFNQYGFKGVLSSSVEAGGVKGNIPEQIAKKFYQFGAKTNTFMHTTAGNLYQYDSTTALNLLKMGQQFSKILDMAPTYKEFSKRVGGNLADGYMNKVFGIGEAEFEALRQVKRTTLKRNKIQQSLGFTNDVEVLTPSEIRNMSDETANQFRRKGETVGHFKERLHQSYFSYLTMQRNLAQTSLSKTSRFIDRGLLRGSHVDMLFRFFTPFLNITNAQWQNLRMGLSLSQFGNPFQTSLGGVVTNGGSLYRFAKAGAFYLGGSWGITTAKDLLNGRTPRDLNLKNLSLQFATSGFGGVPMSIVSTLAYSKNRGLYGHTLAGDLAYRWANAFDSYDEKKDRVRFEVDGHNITKALQKSTGIGNLWYTRGLTNALIRNAFLNKREEKNLEKWYAENIGGESWLR